MLIRDTASGNTEVQDSITSTKQNANTVFLGPVTGASAIGSFRALQQPDLPGGGGKGPAAFPMFYFWKAVNSGVGISLVNGCTCMNNMSSTGTLSSQSPVAGKALRARFATAASNPSSAGLCEAVSTAVPVTTPAIRTIGAMGLLVGNIGLQQTTTTRFWFGLTDQSPNQMSVALTLSSVANASGGSTVYTGTITNGGSNAFAGFTFIITGFTNSANNGTFVCTASSTTTLTLSNASGVAETHAATASYGVAPVFRSDTPAANFIGFRYSTVAGDTNYQIVVQKDATHQTIVAEGGSHVNSTDEIQFAIINDGTNLIFLVDTSKTTVALTDANMPSLSLAMQPFAVIDNAGTANAVSMELSQIRGQL